MIITLYNNYNYVITGQSKKEIASQICTHLLINGSPSFYHNLSSVSKIKIENVATFEFTSKIKNNWLYKVFIGETVDSTISTLWNIWTVV